MLAMWYTSASYTFSHVTDKAQAIVRASREKHWGGPSALKLVDAFKVHSLDRHFDVARVVGVTMDAMLSGGAA